MVAQHIRSLIVMAKRVCELVIRRRLHHRGKEFLCYQFSIGWSTEMNENVKVVKEATAPYRKIDAFVASPYAKKLAEEYSVFEAR